MARSYSDDRLRIRCMMVRSRVSSSVAAAACAAKSPVICWRSTSTVTVD
jgi:hypothetical protein